MSYFELLYLVNLGSYREIDKALCIFDGDITYQMKGPGQCRSEGTYGYQIDRGSSRGHGVAPRIFYEPNLGYLMMIGCLLRVQHFNPLVSRPEDRVLFISTDNEKYEEYPIFGTTQLGNWLN